MDGTSIAVVGAGFSGTLLSLHLLRRCPPKTHIILVERNRQFGRGRRTPPATPATC
jgi:cation diffusion facilitator CzcD-associated flavoprotein CzcO